MRVSKANEYVVRASLFEATFNPDSCANYGACGSLDFFDPATMVQVDMEVEQLDKLAKLRCTQKGTIYVRDMTTLKVVALRDTLYIQSWSEPVYSEGQLDRLGFKATTNEGVRVFSDQDGVPYIVATMGLHYLYYSSFEILPVDIARQLLAEQPSPSLSQW